MSTPYVPAWRKKQMAASAPAVKKPHFPGDAFGGPDEVENTGVRYSPRSPGALPPRRIIRMGPTIKPDDAPILEPTHNLAKLQPKMRSRVLRKMRKNRKTLKKKLRAQGKTKSQIRKIIRKKLKE